MQRKSFHAKFEVGNIKKIEAPSPLGATGESRFIRFSTLHWKIFWLNYIETVHFLVQIILLLVEALRGKFTCTPLRTRNVCQKIENLAPLTECRCPPPATLGRVAVVLVCCRAMQTLAREIPKYRWNSLGEFSRNSVTGSHRPAITRYPRRSRYSV